MSISFVEATLDRELKCKKLVYEREYRFHPTRRWRYDFYIPRQCHEYDAGILVDVQGGLGLRQRGKHARPEGYSNDAEKMHAAQQMGYQVIYVTSEMVHKRRAIEMIEEALQR